MYISLSLLNIDEYIPTLQDALVFGNTVVLLHAYNEYETQELYPIWRNLRNKLESEKTVNIVEIDHEAMEHLNDNYENLYRALGDYNILANDYRVMYPTILLFKNGMKIRYQGKMLSDDIASFLNAKILPKKKLNTTMPKRRVFQSSRRNKPSSFKMDTIHKEVEKAFARLLK